MVLKLFFIINIWIILLFSVISVFLSNMYSTWTVSELKTELKKRGASLRGKKADLIERLELYDQHFNFGHVENLEDSDPAMKVPSNEHFRDINCSTSLPPINKTKIRHYLDCTQKKFEKAVELYESRHLLTARSTKVGDCIYIKGYCRKTMKDLQYEVNVKLDQFGDPTESHCECPAGSGTSSVCKHVAVLLLGVEHMVREKIILCFEVCTQRLQQFHVPKKAHTGTPVRAEKLASKRSSLNLLFEPYPVQSLNKENYNSRVRNLVLNFRNSTMPLKQMYEPANPYALEIDHNYTEVDAKILILKQLKLCDISTEDINKIEESTRSQNLSQAWHYHRRNRLTASNFHTICSLRPTTMAKYADQILNRKEFHSRATKHGIQNEKIAIEKYCMTSGLNVEPCGLLLNKDRPYLAASPDGLVGSDTVVEVKCPFSSRYHQINHVTVPYLDQNLNLKINTPYYYQIQGQLHCSGRSICHLVVYTYKDMKVIKIHKNITFIAEMLVKLDHFYENYFKDVVLRKYLYYNYDMMYK